MRLDETDEPEREPTCGCRYDLEGDTVQLAGLGPGGVWRGETAVQFEFDRVYGPGSKRRDIHQEELRFMVDEALLGTDSALIVSGTSTSGKRHMVIGQPFISSATDGAMSGLAERIVHDVYARDPNEEWTLSVSIYSIFKDIISDLLAPHRNDTSLRLECGKDGYAHVVNLSEVGLTTTADLLMLLRMSIRAREDMETTLSGRDARSTLVLQLKLKNVKSGQRAQIAMLDLGGSEEPQLEGLRSLAVLSPPSPQLDGLLSSPPMSPSFEGEALLGAFKLQQQMHKSPSFEGEASVGAFKLQQLMRKMVEVSTSVVVLCVCSPISESFIGMREGLALAEQVRAVWAPSHPGGVPRARSDSMSGAQMPAGLDASGKPARLPPMSLPNMPFVNGDGSLNDKMVEIVQYLVERESNQLDVKDLENRENRSSSMSSTQSQVTTTSGGRKVSSSDLCEAAFNGDVAQLRVYRAQGANLGLGDYDKRTALHLAASEGILEVVQFLVVEAGVDHSPVDRWGGTPLDDAVRSLHADVMEFLVKRGGKRAASLNKVSSGDLCDAAARGAIGELRKYHEGGADMNMGDYDSRTALHLAASEGIMEVVQFLVTEGGCDPSPVDRWGGTPLDDAYRHKHPHVADFLISSGGQLAVMLKGATATDLCEAASAGNRELLFFYATIGTNMNLGDYDSRTALHLAASEGLLEIVQFLVAELKADPSPVDRWGGTPLDDAIRQEEDLVASFLVANGGLRGKFAIQSKVDAAQRGADLCDAAAAGSLVTLKLLIAQGADANLSDYDSRTALHLAASNGHLEAVSFLIEAGAEPSPVDRWLGTPLDDAIRSKHVRVVEYLRDKGGARGRKGVTLDGRAAKDEGPVRFAGGSVSMLVSIVERLYDTSPEVSQRSVPSSMPPLAGLGLAAPTAVAPGRFSGSEVGEDGALSTSRIRATDASGPQRIRSASNEEIEATQLRTIREVPFRHEVDGGSGTQVDAASLVIFGSLPPALDERGFEAHALVTTTELGSPTSDGPLLVPYTLRSSDPCVLGLRTSRDPRAPDSHVLAPTLPEEQAAILRLVDGVAADDEFWYKKRQAVSSPTAHNLLVRIRRYHRLLEDTKPATLDAATSSALLRMHGLCAVAISEASVPAVYNQAAKAVGEFYCYKYIAPPVCDAANVPKRGAPGSANALLRTGVYSLFGLLVKGYVDHATRAAIRESIRCAAVSWGPALMLMDVAMESMVDSGKYRDVFALRTREMGLTIVYMMLQRHAFSTFRRFLMLQDRATGQPSKLHTLVACIAMAHAESVRSVLNRELANGIVGALRTHVGLETLHDVIASLQLEGALASELLAAAASAPLLDARSLRTPPRRKTVGGLDANGETVVEFENESQDFSLRMLSPSGSSNPSVGSGGRSGSTMRGHSLPDIPTKGLPMSEVRTLRESVFIDDGLPVTQVLPSTLLLLRALPASAVEIANAATPPDEVTASPKDKNGLQIAAGRALRSSEPVGLCLRVNHDGKALKSHLIAPTLSLEMASILTLIDAALKPSQTLWVARPNANAPGVALVHNLTVRIRRWHRLLEDTKPLELELEVVTASLRMLDWCSTVLQQASLPVHGQAALKFIAEYFLFKYVSRAAFVLANTGKYAAAGTPGYSVRSCIAMVFYCLNRDDGQSTSFMVRETLRCIVCSELSSTLLVDAALEAMTTNLKARNAAALAMREMTLLAVYMVLARRDWSELKPFLAAHDRTTGLPQRTCVIVTAMAYALAEADKSPLENALVTRLAVVMHRHLGSRFADVVNLSQLNSRMTEALICLAGIDEDLLRARRKSLNRKSARKARVELARKSSNRAAASSRHRTTRDFFGNLMRIKLGRSVRD